MTRRSTETHEGPALRYALVGAADAPGLRVVDTGIGDFNDAEPELARVRPLNVLATDAGGQVVAGAVGRSWGECCELQQLWVQAALRGRHVGTALMARFEAEARSRGCTLVYLDTFSFQAPGFYEGLGYRSVLVTAGYTGGIVRHTMHKTLAPTVA